MNRARFIVDTERCIGCGKCAKVCPGGILSLDPAKKPKIADFDEFGWNGCWKCEHCLVVCPNQAITIFGHRPEDSLPVPAHEKTAPMMDALIANRHSCRRFIDRDVDAAMIEEMLQSLANAPNGGNKQQVEFTLIDDHVQMNWFRQRVYARMEELASKGIYPEAFGKDAYEDMKRWEKTVRPDMLFCGAPHLLIPHAPLGQGEPVQDVVIAGTYFELLCASRGLGAVMMTFPLSVLKLMPDISAMLRIPEDHYVGMMVGFGWPKIRYAHGTQRELAPARIHRLRFDQ